MMEKAKQILNKYKKAVAAFVIAVAVIITMLGGAKLMVYFGLLFSGVFLGWYLRKVKQLYEDYRLGLRINALQYSAKQYESLQKEKKQLEEENQLLSRRLESMRTLRSGSGGVIRDNIYRNGIAGIREDSETL